MLVESKVCTRWARRNGHRVAELNLGAARFAERRTCVLRWHDLLESWWRLVELGLLGPAERALVQDLLTYAHHDFAHLLPFGSLRRVGVDPVRRKWRLRSLLREARACSRSASASRTCAWTPRSARPRCSARPWTWTGTSSCCTCGRASSSARPSTSTARATRRG